MREFSERSPALALASIRRSLSHDQSTDRDRQGGRLRDIRRAHVLAASVDIPARAPERMLDSLTTDPGARSDDEILVEQAQRFRRREARGGEHALFEVKQERV